MVQINLPKNSEVEKGIYYKDKTGSKNIRKVNVYRWDPSSGENPRLDSYEVDMDNCPSKVLDILNKIKNEIDSITSLQKIVRTWCLWILCYEYGWKKWSCLYYPTFRNRWRY